eukprot:gnl/TRDRNA2_/TRDRNA2_49113_c0_seq1.p1 gnl/TRDRNA2_/TRDRNA2_49113_c0~~gnl/TRDRNA2_/TRDRNA2_49113_c0_seq1.p1  ORF type:complete len:261 (-),score=78.47 gnl/TRDRNA2_/TRDRNA2_49113_c0_seq1:104-886(-)
MEELQSELRAVKEKWGKEIELSKAEKGAPGFPFPVAVTRYVPNPQEGPAQCWDVEELPVRLVFHSADVASVPVSVEVWDDLPGTLPTEIEKAVDAEWRKLFAKKGAKGWQVDKIFSWLESKFVDMCRLKPEYITCYEGVDNEGASCRRYTITAPPGEEDEEVAEEEIDEEEQQRRMEEYIAREQARIEAELDAKDAEAAEKRRLAEQGVFEDGPKAMQLSKKAMAELNPSRKEKSGHRWRKTPSKTHKPDAAAAKEKAKK